MSDYEVKMLKLSDIHIDHEWNSRGLLIFSGLQDFAREIKEHGRLETPVTVRPSPIDGYLWSLVTGYRRCEVARILEWEVIPSFVRNLSEVEARELNLIENIHRTDLNILQIAVTLGNMYPATVPDATIAKRFELPTRSVRVYRALAKMPKSIQDEAAVGILQMSDIERLMRFEGAYQEQEHAHMVEFRESNPGKSFVNMKPARMRRKNEIIYRMADLASCYERGLWSDFGRWIIGEITDEEFDSLIGAHK